jgi:hypothetical protein
MVADAICISNRLEPGSGMSAFGQPFCGLEVRLLARQLPDNAAANRALRELLIAGPMVQVAREHFMRQIDVWSS